MQHRHQTVRIHEPVNLIKNQAPLHLIVGLVSAGILNDMFVELLDQLSDELHAAQQEADDNEAGVVAQLLHHQLRPGGQG